ncbi:hypothetical protein BOW51_11595 [Solemya velesiana gill symbiont]|uniref:Uncharacterized protein n=1 Tax=Solemya velesiana gill symbiont TaxID=1918948 RepID=A0A1T2KR31_9GAMM|nr:hypothetical protein BOW51_11595 [Solemya velesiana gill symbiont]
MLIGDELHGLFHLFGRKTLCHFKLPDGSFSGIFGGQYVLDKFMVDLGGIRIERRERVLGFDYHHATCNHSQQPDQSKNISNGTHYYPSLLLSDGVLFSL